MNRKLTRRNTSLALMLTTALAIMIVAYTFNVPSADADEQTLTSTLSNFTVGVAAASSPGFCFPSLIPPCAPERGEDEHTQTYTFSETIDASAVISATLSYSGAVEMFIGQPSASIIPSDCTPIIGFNGFTTAPATDFVLGVIDDPSTELVLTQFPLDQLFIFESYPGQGMPWNAHSTQTVDVTNAIKEILTVSGPSSTIPVSIKFLSAPCNLAQFKAPVASLSIQVREDQNPPAEIINDSLSLVGLITSYDPTPVEGYPGGVFTVTATWENVSNPTTFADVFAEVAILEGAGCPCEVLNADGGPGGVGSQVALTDLLAPGETVTKSFEVGLSNRAPFKFFVDMFAVPE